MNQLFYNIASGIVHQIGREKWTISEVIVRGKRNIKQNRNWFYFKFSVGSSNFIFNNNFKMEKLSLPLKVETDQFVTCLVLPECLPRTNMAARVKTKILVKRFTHAISVHYRDFEHAYV